MLTNYEILEVPKVTPNDPSAFHEAFQSVVHEEQPAILFTPFNTGWGEARSSDRLLAREGMRLDTDKHYLFSSTRERLSYSEYLHIDGIATFSHTSLAEDLSAHRTYRGKIRASFFNTRAGHARRSAMLRNSTVAAFQEGLVDADELEPVCYQTEAGSSDLLMFRARGRAPVSHFIESLELPRKSVVNFLIRNSD